MAWSADDIPSLDGRVAVVTGANGGLGLATAHALAGAGAHVVMAVRNQDKAATAREEILAAHPDASLELVPLDLGDQANVKAAAETIAGAHPSIDILVNNAGLMAMPEAKTADGFEMQLGVNHLGHWTFTAGLLSSLLGAPAARVVTVTSTARHFGLPVKASNPHLHGNYRPWSAYGQAKLANYHFALGLDQQFRAVGAAAQSLTAHPGLSNTDLQSRTVREGGGGKVIAPFFENATHAMGMSPTKGATMQLRAATDPAAHGGELYAPRLVAMGAAVRRPVLRRLGMSKAIATLWDISERETGVALDVAEANGT